MRAKYQVPAPCQGQPACTGVAFSQSVRAGQAMSVLFTHTGAGEESRPSEQKQFDMQVVVAKQFVLNTYCVLWLVINTQHSPSVHNRQSDCSQANEPANTVTGCVA